MVDTNLLIAAIDHNQNITFDYPHGQNQFKRTVSPHFIYIDGSGHPILKAKFVRGYSSSG